MRKILLLVSMLALALFVASPAMAEDKGGADDGDDVVVSGDTNTNENENINNNNNENNVDVDVNVNNEVVVNLANFNTNVNTIIIGGIKVVDLNKDGVITVFECDQQGVSKSAALTFHKKVVVEKDFFVKDSTIVVKDSTVVTGDTVVKDTGTTVVSGDTKVVEGETTVVPGETTVVSGDTTVVSGDTTTTAGTTTTTTAVLPETGGSSLLALGAGALLVAGGLLARRIVR